MRRKPTTHRPPRQAVLPASDRCCRPPFSSREPGPCGEGPSPPALCPEARRALAPLLNPRPATVQTGPGPQHTGGRVCTRAHTHAHADPQEGHPRATSGGGPPGRLAGPPRGLPAAPRPRRHFLSRAWRPRHSSQPANGRRPEPPVPEEAGPCLAGLRVRPAGQGAFLPLPAAGHPGGLSAHCLRWWPWAGEGGPARRAVQHLAQACPRAAGRDAGGHPPSDLWPPNTTAPGTAAARPPRGHACPHSVRAGRTGLSEDARPGFESRPNPHELARTRPASELSASPGGAAVRTARLPGLSGARSQRRSIRGARCMTGVAARQGH